MAPRVPPCIWRMKKIQTPISSRIGSEFSRKPIRVKPPAGLTEMLACLASMRLTRSSWLSGVAAENWRPPWSVTSTIAPRNEAVLMSPWSTLLSSCE
jgi:hypothetical protein